MYPKNNATPERLAIGQVVLIADGTIQSTASIVVRGQGGAEAAGAGTTVFGADNTIYYTPTQAETNFSSFVVIAFKAACFSASQTVITTQSATAGQVRLEGVTHTGSVIPIVTANTDMVNEPDNAGIAAILTDTSEIGIAGAGLNNIGTIATVTNLTNLPAIPTNWLTAAGIDIAALDGKGNWNLGKTGYSLSGTKQTFDALNDIAASAIVSAGAIDTSGGAVVTVVNNVDMRGNDTVPDNAGIAAILADTADMQPKLGIPVNDLAADLAAAKSTTDAIKADTTALNEGIIFGNAVAGTLTTTQVTTSLTTYSTDQLIGRVLIVTSGNAKGEGTSISASSSAGLLTFDLMKVVMADTDTFKIV